ncbi:MAG: hypothetical protein V1660_02585 [archaeon]
MTLENESMFPINPAGLEKVMKEIVEGKPEIKKEESSLEERATAISHGNYESLKAEFNKKVKSYEASLKMNYINNGVGFSTLGGAITILVTHAIYSYHHVTNHPFKTMLVGGLSGVGIASSGIIYTIFRSYRKTEKYKQNLLADPKYKPLIGKV